jgi:hypothetical protein
VLGLEAFTERVERTRADVAVDDTDREQRQLRETASVWSGFGMAKNCSEASWENKRSTPGAKNPKATVN